MQCRQIDKFSVGNNGRSLFPSLCTRTLYSIHIATTCIKIQRCTNQKPHHIITLEKFYQIFSVAHTLFIYSLFSDSLIYFKRCNSMVSGIVAVQISLFCYHKVVEFLCRSRFSNRRVKLRDSATWYVCAMKRFELFRIAQLFNWQNLNGILVHTICISQQISHKTNAV